MFWKLNETWYLDRNIKVDRMLPDFLLIGAMKAGTTSLHNYLDQHPGIFMTYIKEPGIFLDEPVHLNRYSHIGTKERLSKMMMRGYKGEKRVGESSTIYSEAPSYGLECPENIHKIVPNMKFIYLLRNPFARIRSHYSHCLQLNLYSESYDLNSLIKEDKTFLERSLYYFQLSRYLELFPKGQFKIVFFEEFLRDHKAVLKEIAKFLEVDSDVDFNVKLKQKNKSITRTKVSKKFSKDGYNFLIDPIREDIEKLEKFLNKKLSLWDISEEKWSMP